MLKHQFKQGDKLIAVWYDNGKSGYQVGWDKTIKITVQEICGHMANLPFARVEFTDGTESMLPLHNMDEIIRKTKGSDDE